MLGSVDYIASLCKSEDESRKIKEAVSASAYAALSVNEKDEGNLKVMMLTGDHEASARKIANAVVISEVHSGPKPEDKLNHVARISRETGEGLVMAGDGINDAPALAAAAVSIASATAIAVADVLLLQDDIAGVPFCIAKACQTASLVKQNVALALCSIILASLPSVLGLLPLWLTVLLHEGGTLLVCLNSIRGLNDPAWSRKNNLHQVLDKYNSLLEQIWRQIPSSGSVQPAQLQ